MNYKLSLIRLLKYFLIKITRLEVNEQFKKTKIRLNTYFLDKE